MATDWLWLKNRLVSAKTKANSFWLPGLSASVIDIGELLKCASNIQDHSITGIIRFLNENETIEIDLKRLLEISESESLRRFNTTENLFKIFQNDFSRLYKQVRKQQREFADSSLFIGLPIIEGKTEFGDYFRAPLLYVQTEIEPVNRFQKIILHINKNEYILNPTIFGVQVNKKGILLNNKYDSSKLDLEDALNIFKDLDLVFKSPLTNEIIPFQKKNKSDFDLNNKESNKKYLVNNVLLGIFEVKGDKIFQDFTSIMNSDLNTIDEILSSKKDLIFNHKNFNDKFDLSQIYLISQLDIYQQLAVKHALIGDVVVEGPPGTGKSETILNILINIALNNKTVLFVSEKTTAMEVVYNRLGKLKNIALYVPGVFEQKQRFYKQFADFEEYFASNYSFQLVNSSKASFDENFISNYFSIAKEIQQAYSQNISSGLDSYEFKDILLNFKLIDTNYIQIDNYNLFDEWLNVFTNQDWAKNHLIFLDLQKKINEIWTDNVFSFFVNLWENEKNKKKILFAIHNFLTKKFLRNPKIVNPFFKPNKKEEKMFDLLNLQISKYNEFKKYASDSKFEIIKLNLKNKILENKKAYFYSWFMQYHSEPFISKLDSLQKKINKFDQDFDQHFNQYIESCKRNLKSLILKNFFNLYESNKKELLDICRQSKNQSIKEIPWWFDLNKKIINKLYPIHIMSFESASILLENTKGLYDYVVIDEASQVFLERALPIIYRGKKYIIAGDTKQLRPSNFFQSRANYDEEAFDDLNKNDALETDEAVNAASLIHFLKDRARLTTLLKYHYRSDFSSLIAFTNDHIYDNELIFIDKAIKPDQTFIVHDVVDGKWQNNRNVEEARDLLARLQKLTLTDDYKKTIGIITFNKNQADLIEALLDKVNDPLINEWRERYNANGEYIGLFVKNIENVQGDERDIILFSLGYDKSVNMYGPISKSDGENRLNVAITRAKHRIELFKTNKANEYSGWSSRSIGSKLLVEYLDYCESQAYLDLKKVENPSLNKSNDIDDNLLAITNQNNESKDFQISKSIFNVLNLALSDEYQIKQNVMVGVYLFNFVIYKKEVPVLSIDIDLPQFDGISDFYEKFIYRNIFLKKRGWNYFRIWTSDWCLNHKAVLLKIQQLLLP